MPTGSAKLLPDFFADVSGATAIEYGLIVSLIIMAVAGLFGGVENPISNFFSSMSGQLDSAAS